MRRVLWVLTMGAAMGAAVAGLASAAPYGQLTIGDQAVTLSTVCAIVPRFDMQGWGKPEATLLASDVALDCAAVAGWANPDSGGFDQAVERGNGSLLSVSFQKGLALGRVSVYTTGATLGNDTCEGCRAKAAYAGAGLRGSVETGPPLSVGDTPVAFTLQFDLARPAAPAPGEKLAGGGEPGKVYQAYLKAYRDGDYAALQRLAAEGEAEDRYGYYDDEAERRKTIQDEGKPTSAKILEAFRVGDSAFLIVEVPHPYGEGEKVKALVGLAYDGTGWRVREERLDFGGLLFGP